MNTPTRHRECVDDRASGRVRRSVGPPEPVLRRLGVGPGDLLGEGGEAWVYALDARRVARVHRARESDAAAEARAALLVELGRSAARVPFALPEVLETVAVEGRIVAIERRLPGRPLRDAFRKATGEARAALVHSYLDAAAAIGDLRVERPWYGDLCAADPVRARTFPAYLERRAAWGLERAGPGFCGIDAARLAAALPEPAEPAFVHLDAFPGNMLGEAGRVTAVLDFGAVSIIGDRRLDPLAAVTYLEPPITPAATRGDRAVAHAWLAARGLDGHLDAARRWIAAYWSFATDSPALHDWCRSILL